MVKEGKDFLHFGDWNDIKTFIHILHILSECKVVPC